MEVDPLFSPSSLTSLELCPRKFAWDKIDKIPRESNRYAEFGTKVHSLIESYYLHGIMPDLSTPEGNCAVALLAHLPPPQPGVRVEERRIVGRFHGFIDLTLGPKVWDHKTTSKFETPLQPWIKTPETLPDDLQCALYSHFVMQETGELHVQAQWNYVTREKRPHVLPVIAKIDYGKIARTLDRAHRLADQGTIILRDKTPALELPPNPAACDAFGGCQHRNRCNLSASQRMEGFMNMTTPADFLADMNAKHPAPPAPPAPPPPAPAGNPWDGLPATHVTETQWYNPAQAQWVAKTPVAPPPPPAPPPAPAAVVASVPINPPIVNPPTAVIVYNPETPGAGTFVKGGAAPPPAVVADPRAGGAAPPPPAPAPRTVAPETVQGPTVTETTDPLETIALSLETIAEAIRAFAGGGEPATAGTPETPVRRGPGRPRKVK